MDTPRITADKILDVSGLSCPIPLLKTKKVIEHLSPGEILQVISTDPSSQDHIPALCERYGNIILAMSQLQDGVTSYFIQKTESLTLPESDGTGSG